MINQTARVTPLRQRMVDAMVLRGFAVRTQQAYGDAMGLLAAVKPRNILIPL